MAASNIHHPANLADFDALLAKNPFLIVDFYADWCPPCKMIAPIFEQLATYNSPNVAFAKVNTDYRQDIALRYNVTAMPTFIFFKDGKVEGAPLQGAIAPVLMRFTGVFAQLARERKEQAAAAAAKAAGASTGESTPKEQEEAGDEEAQAGSRGDGVEEDGEDARQAKPEAAEQNATTTSGGYTLGAEGGKRADWRMSLHA